MSLGDVGYLIDKGGLLSPVIWSLADLTSGGAPCSSLGTLRCKKYWYGNTDQASVYVSLIGAFFLRRILQI